MNKELSSKSKKAFFWDLSGAFVRQFVSFFISILLARLLGPEEFGLVALSMIVINISNALTDIGFTSALVQKKSVNNIAYSSVFYVNLLLGISLSIIIVSMSSWIALFFENDELKYICLFLAVIPIFNALGSIHTTILTKTLDFKSLAVRNTAATTIAGIIAIIAAFYGLGVYSLVIQYVLSAALGTIVVWIAIKWKPKLEFSYFEIKELFSYSSYIFLDNILRRVFINIDTAFIGKVFSPAVLGFYNRAQSLKSQVETYSTQSLSKIIFPVLSQLQDDREAFIKMYSKTYKLISGLIVLLVAPLYFLAEFIIISLLGEEWRFSITFFKILILGSLVAPHIGIMAKALLAKGFSKIRFKMGLVQRVLMLLPLAAWYYFGLSVFAATYFVVVILMFLLFVYQMKYRFDIKVKSQIGYILTPNVCFLIFLLTDYFVYSGINQWIITGSFIILHTLFMLYLKHESYLFILNNVKRVYKSRMR